MERGRSTPDAANGRPACGSTPLAVPVTRTRVGLPRVDQTRIRRLRRRLHATAPGGSARSGARRPSHDSHRFVPPGCRAFRTVSGTSFAAPSVSHIVARIFSEFPDASSNLVRALLADSARVPVDRPAELSPSTENDPSILRIYGYGRPDLARCIASETNDALLIADSIIELDRIALYEIHRLQLNSSRPEGTGGYRFRWHMTRPRGIPGARSTSGFESSSRSIEMRQLRGCSRQFGNGVPRIERTWKAICPE